MHGTGMGLGSRGLLICCCVLACWLKGGGCFVLRKPVLTAKQPQLQASPVCKGLHKAEVDWWVMLKHPNGYQYSYIDSSRVSASLEQRCSDGSCWQHGLSMQNPNPVSHTLVVLEAAGAATAATPAAAGGSLAFVIYNDADPAGVEHFDFAHAKGVVAFSHAGLNSSSSSSSEAKAGGFWLIHSAPRFPHAPGTRDWMQLQRPQTVFGQHFSCFSLAGSASIAAVADMLVVAGPYVFSSRLPAGLAALYPGWQRVCAGAFEPAAVSVSTTVTTTAGQQLHVFAKTPLLNLSLTDAVVGPGLGLSMFWETWRRSHDALPSVCGSDARGPHSSLNVARIGFQGTRYYWDWNRDHSKWGVSSNAGGPDAPVFVCLGDQNRAGWQAHRGGSYACLPDTGMWQAFHSIVAAAEPCVWLA